MVKYSNLIKKRITCLHIARVVSNLTRNSDVNTMLLAKIQTVADELVYMLPDDGSCLGRYSGYFF